ncbi:NACHT domain-containing protein [Streptomyces sedi]|uniref:NACHT domain-containing protein n=1 Tax=Streptomyces sedi TaxID=555059 RepID=A0A5C4V090_9ACTN|nr:NACHT domain-containing protein [Streptomyces sedi]TNM29430.1 NACHT domain-containing protein [Streptomyces sedi]
MVRDPLGEDGTGAGQSHNAFSGTGEYVFQGREFHGDITINQQPRTERPSARAADDRILTAAADDLAFAVKRQWEKEVALRRLNDPYPLPVRWRAASAELLEPWTSIVRLATTGVGRASAMSPSAWAAEPQALSGTDGELVDVLARVPTGRLVVLGEPGSGKSVLLVRLVLDLLARRHQGAPVPLLVPLASWAPDAEDLDGWLEQRLGTDYPALGERGRTGATRGRELLDAGLIMLVLDGLDEIPGDVRGRAIARINDTMGGHPDLGLVLASRSDPFLTTVRAGEGIEVRVTGAAGIELLPLDLDTVVSYLRDSAAGPTGVARWREVFAALSGESARHPLARLLTTPLMASLARTAYNSPPEEGAGPADGPVELLDSARFPTPEAMRAHLLDAFLPASYGRHPAPTPRREWNRRQASHFLAFLAADLEGRQRGSTDLRWWELAGATPRLLAGVVVGLAAVPAAWVMPFGPWLGLGMVVGVVVAMLARRWSPPAATFNRGLGGGLVGSLLGALVGLGARHVMGIDSPAGYLVSGLALGLIPGFLGGFRAGLAGGFAASIVGAFAGEPAMGKAAPLVNSVGFFLAALCVVALGTRAVPARGLRWSPLGIVNGLAAGVAIGLAVVLQSDPLSGAVAGLVAAAAGSFGAGLEARPAEATVAADPQTVLRQDRVTFWTIAMAGGIGIGSATVFVVGADLGLWKGVQTGVANAVATGLAWAFLQATYGRFTLARCWLAARRRLPWRLMPFLADAHRRGVLRQGGATYQFRHAELQRRLARGTGPPDRLSGVPARPRPSPRG